MWFTQLERIIHYAGLQLINKKRQFTSMTKTELGFYSRWISKFSPFLLLPSWCLADLHREQGKGGFGDSFGSPCLDLEGFHVSRTNTMNYSSG